MKDTTPKVTRDVISDLLPAYESGEASADTRTLVEEFLRRDPDLADQVERERRALRLDAVPVEMRQERALEALVRTRSLLRRRTWFLALALFFTALPLSIAGDSDSGVTWFMLRDAPWQSLSCWLLSLGWWIGYATASRRLRPTEL